MKRVCFIEFGGILSSHMGYTVNVVHIKKFLTEMRNFCKNHGIEMILISGFHENVAKERFAKSIIRDFFDKQHFFFVDDGYISSKQVEDAKLHRANLEKDKEFNDSYFKQVLIQQFMHDNSIKPNEILLLCNDLWVDAYYTSRFSKVDFAIFEDNVRERGNKADRISGLAYFNLNFNSVKLLLENFPQVDLTALDKFVFEKMKAVLIDPNELSKSLRGAAIKKIKDKAAEGKNG